MIVAAAVFLRWIPHHGWFVGTLVVVSAGTAMIINASRKKRLQRAVCGINQNRVPPDMASTAAIAASVMVLAFLGIYTVLFLPLYE